MITSPGKLVGMTPMLVPMETLTTSTLDGRMVVIATFDGIIGCLATVVDDKCSFNT